MPPRQRLHFKQGGTISSENEIRTSAKQLAIVIFVVLCFSFMD